jgi:hypothetical protein
MRGTVVWNVEESATVVALKRIAVYTKYLRRSFSATSVSFFAIFRRFSVKDIIVCVSHLGLMWGFPFINMAVV